jgi:hypothetical protein
MKKQRIIANALHKGAFEVVPYEGRGAMTEIPVNDSQTGVIHLPEVDGRRVTENTLESLKAHEYGHIVLTERDILPLSFINEMQAEGATPELIQTCMDAAVNAFIGNKCRYLPFESQNFSPKKYMEMYQEANIALKASMLLQHLGVYCIAYEGKSFSLDEKDLVKTSRKMRSIIKKMQEDLIKTCGTTELVTRIRAVVNYCDNSMHIGSRYFSYDTYLERCKNLIESAEKMQNVVDSQDEFNENILEEYRFEKADDMTWGAMTLQEAEMDKHIEHRFKQRHNPRYIGSLRYMHRAITDMRVWGVKERGIPPMVILVDCSGSMHVRSASIENALSTHPASMVAGYSGSKNKGAVYVIGKNGNYASSDNIEACRIRNGYGNIIDGPALTWLSQQKGRLIWITDGNITGSGESQNLAMFEFVQMMVKRHNIECYKSFYAFENDVRFEFTIPNKIKYA